MKALLIVPSFPQLSFWSAREVCRLLGKKYTSTPLGLLTVAALLPERWEIRFVDKNSMEFDPSLYDWADVVLTGGMITQQRDALAIIREAKRRGLPVAVGGPDATSEPHVYQEADFLVLDEGEITVPKFVAAFESGSRGGIIRADGERPDIALAPVPRFDLVDCRDYLYPAIQSSRGCPYTCEFCDIIELYGRVPRFKSPPQFLRELDALAATGYRGHVFIVDDNFIGNKKMVKELLRAIAVWQRERDYPFYFSTEATITLADDEELLALMGECDFRIVFVGIETPDPDLLKATQKKQNTVQPLVGSVRRLNEAGMMVTSGFILGFDGEKPGAGRAIIDFVQEAGILIAGCGLLMALPETQLERRLAREGRLLVSRRQDDFGEGRLYDQITQGLNFVTKRPRLEIVKEFRELRARIYSPELYFPRLRTLLRRLRPRPRHRPSLRDLPGFIAAFLRGLGMFLSHPRYWSEWAKTLAVGAAGGTSRLGAAAVFSLYFLHLGPQSEHVVADLDRNIRDIERLGEEEYNRRRHLERGVPPPVPPGAPPRVGERIGGVAAGKP